MNNCKPYPPSSNRHSGTVRPVFGWRKFLKGAGAFALGVAALLHGSALAQTAGAYAVTNILSDGSVPAIATDKNFIDPWGVSIGKDFWINANVTGLDYVGLKDGSVGFTVTIPPASGVTGTGTPTGTVFNDGPGFVLSNGFKASFLFVSLDGTISGWNGALFASGNHALLAVDHSAQKAVYTDMALVTNANGTYILASNFGAGADIEVYDSNFNAAKLAGSFTDTNLPAGYAPYSVHTIGTQVFVTYTARTTPPFAAGAGSYSEILGAGTGIVSVFDVNGNFVSRAVTGGNLNAPWGVAIAPAGFGVYGGALLVGNFGDGLINVYDAKTYAYLGQVADGTGKALAYPGLWEIVFGTESGSGATVSGYGDADTLYFTAGLDHETHGLFGSISNSKAASPPTFNLSTSSTTASVSAGSPSAMTISLAPSNSFAGSVNLSCSGLPTGATCNFASSSLSVLANAPVTTTLTISAAAAVPGTKGYVAASAAGPGLTGTGFAGTGFAGLGLTGVAAAVMLPFGSFLLIRRRNQLGHIRLFGAAAVLFISTGLIAGCGGYGTKATPGTPGTPGTPAGVSNVTISAISGGITQTTVVAVTVK